MPNHFQQIKMWTMCGSIVLSRYFMMTSSNGNIFRVTSYCTLCGEFIFPHKGQWRGALMFSLICALINGSVNNREAGDLIRHRAHYDVTVIPYLLLVVYYQHRMLFGWGFSTSIPLLKGMIRRKWNMAVQSSKYKEGYWRGKVIDI